ncbi:hypothetical protein [Pedobacter cryoconitis]|uniref:hypothetical protein n=1 Tax=Pedobacter cryoconitis TaxID=188932 RepID=UPI00147494F5|nr:hypothetical protein [Pedobacter cryoconitis]
MSTAGSGIITVTLPKDFNAQDFEILGLIHDKNNGGILGAAKVVFNLGRVSQ